MKQKRVELFVPCCIDQLYPQTAFNTIKVLEHLGLEVTYNPEQVCCGQTAFKNGYWDEAKEIGEKFINDFNSGLPIICPSASCAAYVKNHYKKLFHNSGLHLEYLKIRENIYELTDYIVNVLHVEKLGAQFPHKVTFHDSCSALREYGLKDEPRRLLRQVRGLSLLEMEDSDDCCGFGGAFSLAFEPISVAMVKNKVEKALATGAEYIVSTDSTCLGNMEAYIRKQGLGIRCIHIADILACGLDDVPLSETSSNVDGQTMPSTEKAASAGSPLEAALEVSSSEAGLVVGPLETGSEQKILEPDSGQKVPEPVSEEELPDSGSAKDVVEKEQATDNKETVNPINPVNNE